MAAGALPFPGEAAVPPFQAEEEGEEVLPFQGVGVGEAARPPGEGVGEVGHQTGEVGEGVVEALPLGEGEEAVVALLPQEGHLEDKRKDIIAALFLNQVL